MTDKAPITLSGKVYVGVYLAPYYPEHKLPPAAVLQRGDIKVDSHLDDRGRANRNSKTKKGRMRGYSGYFTGLLWDGEGWRKFKIADIVEHDGWYTSQKFKQMKIHSVIWKLERVGGRIAVAGDGTFLLSAQAQAVVEAPPPPPPPPPPAPVPLPQAPQPEKTVALAKPVQLTLF
jgi:hypothetical protein